VRSASPFISRFGILAVCGLLLLGGLTGCSTTQEKAAKQQAQSKRILEAREQRQLRHSKTNDHGSQKR
jgi:hypothetical protein